MFRLTTFLLPHGPTHSKVIQQSHEKGAAVTPHTCFRNVSSSNTDRIIWYPSYFSRVSIASPKFRAFQILAATNMEVSAFWNAATCSLIKVYRRFRCGGDKCSENRNDSKILPDYMAQHPIPGESLSNFGYYFQIRTIASFQFLA
jgi:hypothetical protein